MRTNLCCEPWWVSGWTAAAWGVLSWVTWKGCPVLFPASLFILGCVRIPHIQPRRAAQSGVSNPRTTRDIYFHFFFCEAHYFSYVIDLLGLTRLCSHVLLPAFFFKVFHCCFTLNENDFEAPVSCWCEIIFVENISKAEGLLYVFCIATHSYCWIRNRNRNCISFQTISGE